MDSTIAAPSSLLDDEPPRPRTASVPQACDSGVLLRALLFVQVVVAVAAAFAAADAAAWLTRTALAATVAVPATLAWLVVACSATPLLARLPRVARGACMAAAGGLAAWAACLPWRVMGRSVGEATGTTAIACAGAILAATIWQWLELRQRATLPAATEARLAELQARVRPHFLFNTLNVAIALVRIDPERAEQVLEDLADLFRAALGALESESTLGEEIRLARMYIDIERMRFGERLVVEWDIDEAVASARVPPLVLQPLVENAVRHGIEPNAGGGRLQVRAGAQDGRAWVQVINTVGAAASPGHGIGLAGSRERLRLMHDLNSDFQSGPTGDGHWRVRLAVPLST
ncbi:MAG TPA: histidine kinase [Burkholderiaceae bacterium]|jgi:two-component system sensor histidine kinase AlgZ|nr:histidine kinase [Burkholderiaceae bacterium]